jgi:pyrroline-5-carboxylate reductase
MTRILLVGCGKMGGALLDGWLDRGIAASDIMIVDPAEAKARTRPRPRVAVAAALDHSVLGFGADVVVLAVKPQMMAQVLPPYRSVDGAVFLSIAAGKTLAGLNDQLGGGRAIVRAMPNTPAAVRRGMTVMVANGQVNARQRAQCTDLLAAVGETAWVDDEALIDGVTAVSGSGPAYVFFLVEAMAEAGVATGLPRELAEQLARSTVCGAGELLYQSLETAGRLRENVTSPGGTTFAALQVLMRDQGMVRLMTEAIAAAASRSRELAS